MIDYIKLLNENNLNLGIIAIVLVIIFTLLFISIICYIFIVQEEILEIIFCFFVFVLFAGFYYAHSEIDTKENIAKVLQTVAKNYKKYNFFLDFFNRI